MQSKLLWRGLNELSFGFAVFDEELKLVACNTAFHQLRGYPKELCIPGVDIKKLFEFNARRGDYGLGQLDELILPRLQRARSGKPHALEYELATKRILSIEYRPIAREGLLIAYIDVTDRKRAEDALHESSQRYALAMAGANEGMWDWDAETDDIYVSESYKRLIKSDFPGDRISLQQWLAMIHPDDLAARDSARRAHLEGKAEFFECDYRVRCGDGKYRWFRDRAQSQRDGSGHAMRMSGSLVDVTAQKEAERKLLLAHERIKSKNKMLNSLSNRLSKYLSPQLYASIFSGEQPVELSSKRKKLTIFFSDIIEFATVTERLEAEQLTTLLNHYLSEMSAIVHRHGGTIDKYVGDAIVGFFGDPESNGSKSDAIACVDMALAMQRRMVELREAWHDQGVEDPIQIRIGINTGYCTIGNFGSEERMDYTIIGNEVNVASRLEEKAPPGGVLIAHETFSLIKDTFGAEEFQEISVKGISRPIKCYSVIDRLDALQESGRIIREYQEGVRIFLDLFRGDRKKTIQLIESILDRLKTE